MVYPQFIPDSLFNTQILQTRLFQFVHQALGVWHYQSSPQSELIMLRSSRDSQSRIEGRVGLECDLESLGTLAEIQACCSIVPAVLVRHAAEVITAEMIHALEPGFAIVAGSSHGDFSVTDGPMTITPQT